MKSGKDQNVDYILVNLVPHSTEAPCFEKALNHKRLYSAAGRTNNEKRICNAFSLDTESFKKDGSGVYLYFSLIKILLITFAIISFNSIPIFLSNFKGNGLMIYGDSSLAKSIMKVSLGNQRHEEYEVVLKDQSAKIDIYVSQTLIIFVDIFNSLIFFIFLIYWKIKSDQTVEKLIAEDALPSYYTIQVKHLPPSYSQEDIRRHFNKFGAQVAQVSTVYNYENILFEVKDLIEMVDDYASSSSKKKIQIYEKIAKKLNKIRNQTKSKIPKPVISIVTFEDMIMCQKIRDLYKYNICPRQLRFDGRMPKVSYCRVEPSSILWQNYHLKELVEIRQSIIISIILGCALFGTLLALFLVNAHSTSMSQKQQSISKSFDYSKDYTFEEAKSINTLQVIYVFCSKLNYLSFSINYYYFCEPYFSSYKQRFEGMITVSILVVAINFILNTIISQLAKFRRYKTKTQKSQFLILNTFLLSFINSGLLMLLIRVEIGGYSLGRLVSKIVNLPEEYFSNQAYPDFNRKWYMNIGSQIVMIQAVSLFTTPFIQIILNWFQSKFRAFKAKRAKTQIKMNQTLMDNEFDFQNFYAMILNACFFTMFHANGIPILYLLAIGAFFTLFVASFIVFRYFSCKPVMFDHSLNSIISRVMCIALIMHQVTSILYIYTEDIFPLDIDHHQKEENISIGFRFVHKLHQSVPFILLIIIFSIFTVNYNRVCKIAKKYVYTYFGGRIEKQRKPRLFSEIFGAAAFEIRSADTEQIACRNRKSDLLSSYKMQQNPNYSNICYALKILSIFEPYFSFQSKQVGVLKRKQKRYAEQDKESEGEVLRDTERNLVKIQQNFN